MRESAPERFKKQLRELREKRAWMQAKAAEACGLNDKVYQLYEVGIKQNPGLLNLEKIADGYGLDVSELLAPDLPKIRAPQAPARRLPLRKK